MSGAEGRAGLAGLPEKTIMRAWEVFASHPTDALYIRAHLGGTTKPMVADEANLAHLTHLENWLNSATLEQLTVAGALAEAYIHNAPDEQYANFDEEIPGV